MAAAHRGIDVLSTHMVDVSVVDHDMYMSSKIGPT